MNDSAPPPPAAPPPAESGQGSAPQSWQDPTNAPYPPRPQAPAFDPRRAIGGNGINVARQGTNPVMAPPPMRQTDLARGARSPFVAPASFEDAKHSGPPPHTPPPYGAQPAFAPQPYAPASQGQNYVAPQPVLEHPHGGGRVEPVGGRASLLSKLTGRSKRDRSEGRRLYSGPEPHLPATPPTPAPWSDHSAQTGLADAAVSYDPHGADLEPVEHSARKPFLMGVLTGVVVMLILGQVFRAASPTDEYAQALPPINMTVTDGPLSDDPEIVAFLDRVDGLD